MYLCVSQNWSLFNGRSKMSKRESSVYLQGVTRCGVFFPWLPSFEERNGSNCHIIVKFICLFVLCHQNGDPEKHPEKHICKAGFFLLISGSWFRMWSYPSLPDPSYAVCFCLSQSPSFLISYLLLLSPMRFFFWCLIWDAVCISVDSSNLLS